MHNQTINIKELGQPHNPIQQNSYYLDGQSIITNLSQPKIIVNNEQCSKCKFLSEIQFRNNQFEQQIICLQQQIFKISTENSKLKARFQQIENQFNEGHQKSKLIQIVQQKLKPIISIPTPNIITISESIKFQKNQFESKYLYLKKICDQFVIKSVAIEKYILEMFECIHVLFYRFQKNILPQNANSFYNQIVHQYQMQINNIVKEDKNKQMYMQQIRVKQQKFFSQLKKQLNKVYQNCRNSKEIKYVLKLNKNKNNP